MRPIRRRPPPPSFGVAAAEAVGWFGCAVGGTPLGLIFPLLLFSLAGNQVHEGSRWAPLLSASLAPIVVLVLGFWFLRRAAARRALPDEPNLASWLISLVASSGLTLGFLWGAWDVLNLTLPGWFA